MYMKLVTIAVLSVCLLPRPCAAVAAEDGRAPAVLGKIGATRGICVLLGDRQCRTAVEIARHSELTVYVQLPTVEQVQAAARAADAAGMYGTRIYVEQGTPSQIGLADNVADAVVAMGDASGVSKDEVLRVLRPEGKAILGDEQSSKPFPAGMDDWSHHYHGPDNNSQSKDQLARAPYLTQFVAEPRYAPAPQVAVASAGRMFMAFGHVAWHRREEPWMNTLVAVNGFNGTMLWKRPLSAGIMVDRSTMIATPEVLYLAGEKSCRLIDAATGELRGRIVAPADLTGGTFWKWMALDGGVLYALVGEQEPPDPAARWRRGAHGWPWGGVSQGYNAAEYPWGFANTLLAIDPKTKKILWHHREDPAIDSRSLCLSGGRIYFCNFGKYLACLNTASGELIWKRTAAEDAEIFRAIGPYRPGHGYVGGWKSTVYLKCTDKALYFIGPQVEWLTALSTQDGSLLWEHPVKDLHVVIRDDGLYTIGAQKTVGHTKKLDPTTGKVLAEFDTQRRACTRTTGAADGILFRAHGGSGRLDLASGKMQWISAMRPSCHVGVVIANGHLYWVPWTCDCNLQMFGVICCGPAGKFAFDRKADRQQRFEKFCELTEIEQLQQSPGDWPTYRAGNTRAAETSVAIPEKVGLLWQFTPGAEIEPTAPVTAGGMVFVAGADGIVRALDAASGAVRWTAYTAGAVRYPPTISDSRALVGSGDGWVYAFEAATGRLLWRFRAAPAQRRIPVYGALLSTWPVAGGVLVEDGTAYFAAGINDFDGTHVYALDAATGKIRWQNNTCGHLDTFSRRGAACQGEMLLHGGKLYLAGGNAVSPAVFDVSDGRCLNAPPNTAGTRARRGRELRLAGANVTVSGQPLYSVAGSPVFDRSTAWQDDAVIGPNARLSCRQQGAAWTLAAHDAQGSKQLWTHPLPHAPVRWAIAVDAEGRVVVTLRNGQVLCVGTK